MKHIYKPERAEHFVLAEITFHILNTTSVYMIVLIDFSRL